MLRVVARLKSDSRSVKDAAFAFPPAARRWELSQTPVYPPDCRLDLRRFVSTSYDVLAMSAAERRAVIEYGERKWSRIMYLALDILACGLSFAARLDA